MANIVIVSTATVIKVEFNIYSTALNMSKGTWSKEHVSSIILRTSDVVVSIQGENDWVVSWNGSVGSFQIDSIDAVAPVSNSDLYDKLIALI